MKTDEILETLFALRDEKYAAFQTGLIPTASAEYFIGVRTPDLRRLAKEIGTREDVGEFLAVLPHRYFDENQLHAFILSGMKDYDRCIAGVNAFLPFVDNWATCDQMSPKVFKKHKTELLDKIEEWLKSDKTYTVRFAVGMLMEHFLSDDFDISYPETVAAIRSEEYYVRMMVAWYFATALAKQYDAVLPFIEGKKLDPWTHNKAITKSIESYRITDEHKKYLRSLKIKKAAGAVNK